MQNVDGEQLATSSWVEVTSMLVNTYPAGETRLTYYFQTSTNTVQVKIQASVNNINWIDLNTRDMLNPDEQHTVITVDSSAVAVIAPEDFNGINSGFQYYRLMLQGSAPYGTLECWADAK